MTDWNALIENHGRAVFRISWRILGNAADVEDNVQEVLLAAVRFSRKRKVASWEALLRRLAVLKALDRLRERYRRRSSPLDERDVPVDGAQPEEALRERELTERLRRAVARLPNREAVVFSLRTFEDCTLDEISTMLGIGYSAAGAALSRARKKLETEFREEMP